MASGRISTIGLVAALLVAMPWPRAIAQSSCTNVLISMAPCVNYVTGISSTPSSSCCSQLATVVRSQPQCLCLALNGGGASLGVNINRTLALALPGACNVQTPPVSKCAANNQMSPAGSPQGLPGGGSKAAPIESGSSGNGPNKSLLLQSFVLFLVFIMASTFGGGV